MAYNCEIHPQNYAIRRQLKRLFLHNNSISTHKTLAKQRKSLIFVPDYEGEMVEWSITPVLKTGALRGAGGSNPSLSASANALCCQPTRGISVAAALCNSPAHIDVLSK